MSPRKTILRELSKRYDQSGREAPVRPSEITGFQQRPGDYQKAVNQLLQDRLIQGMKDNEGRMTITLNAPRVGDIRKEIRPIWMNPTVWGAAAVLGALVSVLLVG